MANESGPAAYIDPALVNALGTQNVFDEDPIMASEGFILFGLDGHGIPTVMFWLGAMDPKKLAAAQAAGKSLPGPHTTLFELVPEPTLRTGVTAMTSVAIALLQH